MHNIAASTAVMTSTPEPKTAEHHVKSVDEDERKYLTGIRIAIVLASVTLVSFLVLLDMSILGTARKPCSRKGNAGTLTQPGYPKHHHRIQFTA